MPSLPWLAFTQVCHKPKGYPEIASYVFVGALEIVITARVLAVLRVEEALEAEYYEKVARTVVDVFLGGLGREAGR